MNNTDLAEPSGVSRTAYDDHMSGEVMCAACADKKTRSEWIECDGCDANMCPMKNYNP